MRTEPGVNIKKKVELYCRRRRLSLSRKLFKTSAALFPKKTEQQQNRRGGHFSDSTRKTFQVFLCRRIVSSCQGKKKKERNCRDTCHNVSLNLAVVEIPSGPNQIVWPAGRGISFDPDRRWPSFLLAS